MKRNLYIGATFLASIAVLGVGQNLLEKAAAQTAKTATVALMRKMLVTLNAMLRDGQPWKHARKIAA